MTVTIAPELRGACARVRLLALDVDGVLTDGGLYFSAEGVELKRFDVKDGFGLQRLMESGVQIAIVSAGRAEVTRHRARVLGITHVLVEVADKLLALKGLCRELGLGLDLVAYAGDDLNDLPVLRAVGVSFAVADAIATVRATAAYVTQATGGRGAVREICDLLLAARGVSA